MADTVGKQRIRSDSNTDVVIRLADSAGTNLAAVDSSGRQAIDIAVQTLAAVKISRDGLTPAATNGSYAEVTTANAVLAVGNPLPVRTSNGTSFNSVTAPEFVRLTDGTNPFGTVTNPIYTTTTSSGGTAVFRQNNATVTSGATTNIDYTVTASKVLTIKSIIVSGPEAGNYEMIIDPSGTPATTIKLYTSPGSTSSSYVFQTPVTVAAGIVVRIAKENDSAQTAEMGFTWEGTEVDA